MRKVAIAVCDSGYLNHTKSLFGALNTIGGWGGDCALVANGLTEAEVNEMRAKGVKVYWLKDKVDGFMAKNYIFSEYFKKNWDRCIYFDADFVIQKDIRPVFDAPGDFLADKEPFFVHQYWDKNEPHYSNLKSVTNVDEYGFNTSCMVFNTSVIEPHDRTIGRLRELANWLAPINHHTGLPQGTDQPIINIYFQNIWKQIPNVCYMQHRNENTVAFHTCRWSSPWTLPQFRQYYDFHLNYFNKNGVNN